MHESIDKKEDKGSVCLPGVGIRDGSGTRSWEFVIFVVTNHIVSEFCKP